MGLGTPGIGGGGGIASRGCRGRCGVARPGTEDGDRFFLLGCGKRDKLFGGVWE